MEKESREGGQINKTGANLYFEEQTLILTMFSEQRLQQKQALLAFATPAVGTQVFVEPMHQNVWNAVNRTHKNC